MKNNFNRDLTTIEKSVNSSMEKSHEDLRMKVEKAQDSYKRTVESLKDDLDGLRIASDKLSIKINDISESTSVNDKINKLEMNCEENAESIKKLKEE